MGSPIVFHTAPPQPASNARIICSPQFVGGADASQNGLMHGMPQNVLSSVGLGLGILCLQPLGNAAARAFPISNRVNNLSAAVGAVSTSKKLWVGSLSCRAVDEDAAVFKLDFYRFSEKACVRSLSDRQNN